MFNKTKEMGLNKRRFTSEQTEIVETKPNPFIEGDWWRFTVSLPRVQSLAFGGSAGFGMLFFLYSMVLLEKIPENRFIFLVIAGTLTGCVSLFTFFIISIDHSKQIRRGEEKHTTTTPVLFEDTPEPQQEVKEWVKTDNGLWAINYPLTTAQIDHLKSIVLLGQRFTRDKLKSPAFNGFNLTENYPQLLNALHDCGALDENNNWTTAGVEWAKGE